MHSPSQCFSQDISHAPSECMGQDICTPLHSTSARIYLMHLQNIWAWIYALPFTAPQPGYISCTFRMNGLGYMHSPSQRAGREISHAFKAHGPGYIIHSPSQWAGREISCAFKVHGPGYMHSPSEWAGQEISCAFKAHGPGYMQSATAPSPLQTPHTPGSPIPCHICACADAWSGRMLLTESQMQCTIHRYITMLVLCAC